MQEKHCVLDESCRVVALKEYHKGDGECVCNVLVEMKVPISSIHPNKPAAAVDTKSVKVGAPELTKLIQNRTMLKEPS